MDNIILIGMPASGKSTAGVILAKYLGYDFVDCDLAIQNKTGELLHETIKREGAEGFIKIEEEVNLSLSPQKCVLSTGGSAVYSPKAMEHFKEIGTVIYLKVSPDSLTKRIHGRSLFLRGVIMRGNVRTIEELYEERRPLYEKYADITIDCDNITVNDTVLAMLSKLHFAK
ncbi:MAG: shikimate kinase [Clostridia bacterium]|nr:shikimate kinase [Clostridia bacterium]